MVRRRFSILLMLLLLLSVLLPVVSAAGAEKLHDRWVYAGDTFEREGQIYYIEKASTNDKILMYVGESPWIIRLYECKENADAHEKYCVEEYAYDFDEDDQEKYLRYEHGEELIGYHLIIYSLVPELDISRSVDPSSPEIDERSIVRVVLKNEGEKGISNIIYQENITDPLELSLIDGRKQRNTFIYELNYLGAGQQKIFQYGITPRDYVTATVTPVITYTYENIKKEGDLNALSFSVAQPFTITRSLSSSEASVNEKVSYTVTIENEESKKMDVQAEITLPEGLRLSAIDGFTQEVTQEGQTLFYDDELDGGRGESLSFQIDAPYTGEYPFTLSVDATVDGKEVSRFYTEKFTVKTEQLDPQLLFSKSTNKLRTGESAKLRVYLTNNDEVNSFVKVKGTVTSDMLDENVTIDEPKVVAGEEKLVAEIPVVGPALEKTRTTTFKMVGTYETTKGEEFSFSKTLSVTLEPSSNLFDITQDVNVTKAWPGDVVRVKVTVKNTGNTFVFANVYESFSQAVPIAAGNTFSELSFDEGQSREVYIYELRIPEDFDQDQLVITTKVYEKDSSFPSEAKTTLAIGEGPRPTPDEIAAGQGDDGTTDGNETGSGTENDSGSGTGEITQEKGFFTRAWEWLKGLFT